MRLREARFFSGIGRMKPGVTIQQAQADLARVQQQLGEQYPQTDKGWSAIAGDLKEQRVGDYRRTLFLVFGAVALLLLIAVANISGLTLAQLHQREREMAIRSSVGASRGQVIGTVMREVLLIAAAGAVCGAAVSLLLVNVMSKTFADLPRMAEAHLRLARAGFRGRVQPGGDGPVRRRFRRFNPRAPIWLRCWPNRRAAFPADAAIAARLGGRATRFHRAAARERRACFCAATTT